MKILILGVNGFIGSHLSSRILHDTDWDIYGMDLGIVKLNGSMGNEQLSETIDDLWHLDSKVAGILNAWRTGDEAGIEAFNLRELKNYPQLYSALIVDRNRKWAKKIERLINRSVNTIVIVGVAHLAGTESVVDLLRRQGYQVQKLRK